MHRCLPDFDLREHVRGPLRQAVFHADRMGDATTGTAGPAVSR